MADKKTAVCGIYPTRESLEAGVRTLKNAGFRAVDISVLRSGDSCEKCSGEKNAEAAPEGAATGASTGALLGGALGWLAGVGSLTIPGLGPLIAAGPIMGALAGAGAGGAVGGIAGGLVGLGVPESQANRYQVQLKNGATLLCVHPLNPYWTKRAKELLESTGAENLSTSE